jgi:2-succinyl-5-enolpyruvyl-6-hydroxy-3-cyclohexene-1-carboxylate synthase
MLDFRHPNSLWATVAVETLVRLGLTTAVISPGSRSTPLTLAFASHPQVEAIPILDERSASFFALGRAKATGTAVVLLCTSGTAGANYFPAVIEAWESRVPLLILTADRPPELRHCSSGQTIDQQKLFGAYVNTYRELGLPEATMPTLGYLRQTLSHSWQRAHGPTAGPVHLNCPFRDPLAPPLDRPDPAMVALEASWETSFFDHLHPLDCPWGSLPTLPPDFAQTERGVIVAGPAQPLDPVAYCQAIAALAKTLGWPVLAEGLSPLRNGGLNPGLVTTYAALLRQPQLAERLAPEQVLQIGALPTSKVLRQWLAEIDPLRWVIDMGDRNGDPLHGRTRQLGEISLEGLAALAASQAQPPPEQPSAYWQTWRQWEARARQQLDQTLAGLETPFAGKVPWLMGQGLPPNTPVFIANSTPVRDVEWFWPVTNRGIKPHFNRGANGIDGTLSTALGMAHGGQSSVLLTGDLALLHDSNGLLIRPQLRGHLTIVLINNQGGGIFEMLPIAQFGASFETFFATPQAVSFDTLCAAHGVRYEAIHTWPQLAERLADLPEQGIRLLEVRSDRQQDAQQRLALLNLSST